MSTKLLVVGSVALDDLQTRAGKKQNVLGGAATYISIAAGRFCPVNIVGVIGDDFPKEHVELLKQNQVDTTGLEKASGKTFHWSGVYADDFSSRETLDTQLGVFEHFDPKIPQSYNDSRFVLLGNIHPALQLKVLDQLEGEKFVAADTMNLWIDITLDDLKKMIGRVDLLVINDEEAEQLTGEKQIICAADKIRAMGPRYLIIKRGEHGAFLFSDDAPFFAPALPLREVHDPTGAGDSFAGGLMGHLAQVDSTDPAAIKKGMVYGAAVASKTVEGFGADFLATIDRAGVDERFETLRKLVSIT